MNPDAAWTAVAPELSVGREFGWVAFSDSIDRKNRTWLRIAYCRSGECRAVHVVPESKLRERFSHTQKAVGQAALLADMTLMFDNSRDRRHAYSLVRAQQGKTVWFDCRNTKQSRDEQLHQIAELWLPKLAEAYR